MIDDYVTEFGGKAVKEWTTEGQTIDPQYSYRITVDWDATSLWMERFAAFLEDPHAAHVTGLIVGNWGEVSTGDATSEDVVTALTVARDRLPALTALFLGDITQEESEISWIIQSDVSPLFSAYPNLEAFRVRGGQSLRFGGLQHAHLKSLIVETGGLPAPALRDLMGAQLPTLEHLELWLGTSEYGWDGTIEDLNPLLEGNLFPKLQYLGLRNSEIADDIATAIASAPILQHLRVLDLSLGTLSDVGGTALLRSPFLPRLQKLDVHHHYLSSEMVSRLTGIAAPDAHLQPSLEGIDPALAHSPGVGIEVDASDPQKEDQYGRYVAIGE